MNTQILCISEHWLKSEQVATSNIMGFKCASIFCGQKYSHGGVAIYVRNGYHKFKELDLSDIVCEKVFEAVCILCDMFAVICIYRSPSGDVNEFCDKLDQCIQRVNAKKNQVLLCGDFNIDILGYQTSVDLNGKKLMSILQENGLHSITNKSTRVTNMSRSAIDHIITNIDYKQYESKCDIETGLSDHYMQCISVNNVPTLGNSKPFIMRRVFTVKSKAAFCRAIKDQSWQEVFVRTDVNDKFNLFHDMFKKIYDTHFPVKKVRENLTDNKAWVTVGVKVTSRNYRDLCALIKTTNDPTLNSYFKRYRLIYRQVI
ncbi:Neutral ceramidase [Frankliniella fusca]|uniref:Neutral ceramidase n=1 Tax=Frankliniella fusca TaxID=407009 RepID=A0AAE1HAE5_9NEOP|nr:Neutral ceramidase [Frankliniella fusca]